MDGAALHSVQISLVFVSIHWFQIQKLWLPIAIPDLVPLIALLINLALLYFVISLNGGKEQSS